MSGTGHYNFYVSAENNIIMFCVCTEKKSGVHSL